MWQIVKDNIQLFAVISFGRSRVVEAQFQIEAPDPYLGMLVVLSNTSSITYIYSTETRTLKKDST